MSRLSFARPAARARRSVPIAALLAVGCGDASMGAGADLQVAAIDHVKSFDDELDLGLGALDDFTVTSISESPASTASACKRPTPGSRW
jgi:hypothetical protein